MKTDFRRFRMDKVVADPECARGLGLASIFFDVEGKRMVATDGRMLVVVPVDNFEPGETSGLVPVDAWKAAMRHQKVRSYGNGKPGSIVANGSVRVVPDDRDSVNGSEPVELARDTETTFPKFEAVMPKGEGKYRIHLNPQLLARLAEGMGSPEGVTLEVWGDPGKPMRVHALAEMTPDGTVGVLMPIYRD